MAVPILAKDGFGKFDENKFYYPILMTSPAIMQAADSYLSEARLRDIEVQAMYIEKGEMSQSPNWDGSPYDWSDDVTEIQSDFVDQGARSGGRPNILFGTNLVTKEMGYWQGMAWTPKRQPREWHYGDNEPLDKKKIWANTKERMEVLYWGPEWKEYFPLELSLSEASVDIIEQKTGNSFEIKRYEPGNFFGVGQFVFLNKRKLEEGNYRLNASLELEEATYSRGVFIKIVYLDKDKQYISEKDSPRFFNKTAGQKIRKNHTFIVPREARYLIYVIGGVPEGAVRASANKAKLEYGSNYTGWTMHETETNLNLNAGEVPLPTINGIPDKSRIIAEIAILRSALGTHLLKWEEVTRVKASSMNDTVLFDYFVENGNYYRYAIQPILANGTKGIITSFYDTVSTHEGFWLLGEEDIQFNFIYNGNIAEIQHVTKDEKIETLASEFPYFNKTSDLDYRQFQFSGIFTHHQDVHKHFTAQSYTEAISPYDTMPISFVETKYGDEMLLNCQNDLEEAPSGMVMERVWREKILKWFKDGKPKVLKSEAEGTILVYINKPVVRPIKTVYGLVAEFSCQMTEVGKVNEETLRKFKLRKEVITKDDLVRATQNEENIFPYKQLQLPKG